MGASQQDTAVGSLYSPWTAFIYTFNLIVGVGALTLPFAFLRAGVLFGICLLSFTAFAAYVSATYVIEAMAAGNALLGLHRAQERAQRAAATVVIATPGVATAGVSDGGQASDDDDDDDDVDGYAALQDAERAPLLASSAELSYEHMIASERRPVEFFEIRQRVEMSKMADLFLGDAGKTIFYACIIAYLFGDLAIYAVTVPLSLTRVVGPLDITINQDHWSFDRDSVYSLWLGVFIALIGPFCFFNFQKSKYLQLVTMALRNIAFFLMTGLSLLWIAKGHHTALKDIVWLRPSGMPRLFGVAIYSFMAHHSLPSILTPIDNKSWVKRLMAGVNSAVLVAYLAMCVSAVFAFGAVKQAHCGSSPGPPCQVQELYTLNFSSYRYEVVAKFLSFFPVFTISTNFPLIAITLRNNLQQLVPVCGNWPMKQTLFTVLSIGPAFVIAYITRDVEFLVHITGSFAGVGIMFLFPALLVSASRKRIADAFGSAWVRNPYASPFQGQRWLNFIYVLCALILTLNATILVYEWRSGKSL